MTAPTSGWVVDCNTQGAASKVGQPGQHRSTEAALPTAGLRTVILCKLPTLLLPLPSCCRRRYRAHQGQAKAGGSEDDDGSAELHNKAAAGGLRVGRVQAQHTLT